MANHGTSQHCPRTVPTITDPLAKARIFYPIIETILISIQPGSYFRQENLFSKIRMPFSERPTFPLANRKSDNYNLTL